MQKNCHAKSRSEVEKVQNVYQFDRHILKRSEICTQRFLSFHFYIRITYPLEPHFYIVKLGYAGVYLFFLFLLQSIDCGYSLESPHRDGSNMYPHSMFWAKIRKISNIFKFYILRKIYILPGHVFVMHFLVLSSI